VITAGSIYKKEKTKKRAIIALVCGTLAMAIIMIPANLFITPKFMGMLMEGLLPFMPWIILFNFVKAGLNSLVTFLLYKRISPFLHK
jgi:riboflavin transporter FmnP